MKKIAHQEIDLGQHQALNGDSLSVVKQLHH